MDLAISGNRSNLGKGRRFLVLPWLVLCFGLAATFLGTYLLWDYTRIKNQQRASELVQQMNESLQARMQAYIGLLRGGSGLFAANQFVTLDQFRSFWRRLQTEQLYPGMQGFGFSPRLPSVRMAEVQQTLRGQGLTNFHVWPPNPEREEYYPIVYLEPLNERNSKALGYDMFTEPIRRRAMEHARDSGEASASGKVVLVQESTEKLQQNGFLIYVPVYYGGEAPATIEERRQKLHGFIYSPFRAGDLLQGLYGKQLPPELRLELYAGRGTSKDQLVAELGGHDNDETKSFSSSHAIAGEEWTLVYKFQPSFFQGSEGLLIYSPLVGILASLVLFYFTRAEGIARQKSERGSSELSAQREWLQVMLGSIGDGVISTGLSGRIDYMNPAAEELTGWPMHQAKERPIAEVFDVVNEESREVLENPAAKVLRTGQGVKFSSPCLLIRKDGKELCIADSASPIRDPAGQQIGAILVFSDVTRRRRAERVANAQNAVSRVLAESPNFSTAAHGLLKEICEHLNFSWGILWSVDDSAGVAIPEATYWSPNLASVEFEQACANFRPRKNEGLPGLVWAQAGAGWITDFQQDKRFPRAEIAESIGIISAFAFPIKRDSRVLGVLEFFSREKQAPEEDVLRVADAIGSQIGQYLERTRAEAALLESEELHRTVSEAAADALIIINEESTILSVNSAAERVFAYARHEMIGKSLSMLMPGRMRAGHQAGIQRYLETGVRRIPWNAVELPGLRKDGVEVPLEVSFGLTQRGGKNLFVGLLRDITKRKEAEERLRESEERFRLLVSQAEEYAIVTADSKGMISTWNSGAQRIFGYAEKEVVGKPLALLFAPEDRERDIPQEEMKIAAEHGQSTNERWLMRSDGSRFFASGALFCLRGNDEAPRAYAKILRDITERKKAEEAIHQLNQDLEQRVLRRTAALQESKEQMEAFTYTVAHDLRAPLRAMQGFSQALVEDYLPQLDAVAQDYIERIMGSSQKMDALIQDLLAYSQLSRSDLQFAPVDLPKVIEAVLESLEDEITRTGTKIEVASDALKVEAHEATLTHALGNLIGNAMKFTPPGKVPEITIRTVDEGETVQISVQDRGIGIEPQHHDRIFRVFERLHAEEAYPGTGIGLAIVKKGIERMNGSVGLSSEPGLGSIFWIKLPKCVGDL